MYYYQNKDTYDKEYYNIISRDYKYRQAVNRNAPRFREYIKWIWEHRNDDLDYREERKKEYGKAYRASHRRTT